MEIMTRVIVTRGVNKPYVEIPEGVTHVGDEVFLSLSNLSNSMIEHVVLPSTLIKIGNAAFSGCTKLLSVNFSRCTELEEIGAAAFSGCINLRHVHLGNCGKLRTIAAALFKDCEKLVLFIPPHITRYREYCFTGVQCVAMPVFDLSARGARHVLLPRTSRNQMVSSLLDFCTCFYTNEYDKYASVFDAIGQLDVLWIESLQRQSSIRITRAWSKAVIAGEAETKNRVMELWARVEPFDISSDTDTISLFHCVSDIVRGGIRLVDTPSYKRQPEETKLFKNILDYFEVREYSPVDVGMSLANLRL